IDSTLHDADVRHRAGSIAHHQLTHAMTAPAETPSEFAAYALRAPYAGTALHAIDEASELGDRQHQQQHAAPPRKMRRNIMSGIRRVAKAVKAAGKSEAPRRMSTDSRLGAESISHPHMAEGISHLHMDDSFSHMDAARGSMSIAQPAPRQRSLTQQARTPPPHIQQQQQRVRSHHGEMPRVHGASSLASMARVSSASSSSLASSPRARPDRAYASCELPGARVAASAPPAAHSADAANAVHGIYPPRRDRSMTLPGSSASAQPASPQPSLAARMGRKLSVPHGGSELSRLARGIAEAAAPGKLDLAISQSPLLPPSPQGSSAGQSAGARIQRQAEELLLLPLLPSPADTASNRADSSQDLLEHTPLSRIVPPAPSLRPRDEDRARAGSGSMGALQTLDEDAPFKRANDSGVQVNEPSCGSPPSPFSFGHHSRYSLINHDGSLNLASYQFDQLDGYQKRLSGSQQAAQRRRPAADASSSSESVPPQRQRRLMRKPRKHTAGPALLQRESAQPLAVNLWTLGNASQSSVHDRSLSLSTTSSALNARISDTASLASFGSRRTSQQLAGFRRPSDNASASSLQTASAPWPRLMQMAPESVPFDYVYGASAAASLSMEQALTLVEGTAGAARATSSQRHRRLHKRSNSALTAAELDDIMIRTAEMCHSVQTATKLQHAGESGLAQWIASVVGRPAESAAESGELAASDPMLSPQLEPPRAGAADYRPRPEFFSADCSPDTSGQLDGSWDALSADTQQPAGMRPESQESVAAEDPVQRTLL
ncbi:hypothetical protein H4S02_004879, partial [Coemansia sp. RSA 2611]